MDDQQVFDMLAELEEFFFYKRELLNPTLIEIHNKVDWCLNAWHECTGCTNK